MHTHHERGIALVLALFLMTALSVLGASLMFLSQTETYASMNYRMMSQARYAGEAGVQKAGNFLLDSTQYTLPTTAQLADYKYDVSPVLRTSNLQPVVLSAKDAACTGSNYPDAAMQTAFCAAAKGALAAGNASISYNSTATLLAMQKFTSYGAGEVVVQTWQITGDGSLSGTRNATVEVVATIETPKVPANSFAAFGTDSGCGALTFGGNVKTNSYDPSTLSGSTAPTTANGALSNDGGDVGTNGNLTISGHVDVYGKLYTPRTGVGNCTTGNVTALTESGAATVSDSLVQLPSPVAYPAPTIPTQSALPAVSLSSAGTTAVTCALLGPTLTQGTQAEVQAGTAQCNVTGSTITLNGTGSTLSLPSLTTTAQVNIVLVASTSAAQYDFNSISLGGQSTIGPYATAAGQTVVVDVVGKDNTGTDIATPIDFTGGSYAAVTGCATCSAYDANFLQIIYGGTGNIIMSGNSAASAVVYAPNSAITLHGTSDIYGSMLGKTIDDTSGANIHYDSNLQNTLFVPGNPVIGTFTWKRY
ncbi:MAG: pilus assembly PilX N-terminal domain-containing protein [Acidobacteria bacterium]|nr:pilus assembly PilX N-terminal domain-containing protein [Acidobacteriota bacterium]